MGRKRIEFRHLQAFVEVCEHRHFTRASQRLAISQPALSALISQLEQDLGAPLLVRTTRSVEITPAGREFLVSAKRIVSDLLHSVHEIHEYSELRRGRLRIAALPSICGSILPAAVAAFGKLYPSIDLTIIDVVGEEVVDQVVRGRVDFGIGNVVSSDNVVAEPILVDRLVAIGQPRLMPAAGRFSWSKLCEARLIVTSKGTTVRRLIEQGCREAGVTPRIAFEAGQMSTAISYARAGLGIAVLPSSAVVEPIPELVRAELHSPGVERVLSVLTSRESPLSRTGSAFLRVLDETCVANPRFTITPYRSCERVPLRAV